MRVDLRKDKIKISLENKRNHLGKEQDSFSKMNQGGPNKNKKNIDRCSPHPSNVQIVQEITSKQYFLCSSKIREIIMVDLQMCVCLYIYIYIYIYI